GERESGQLVRAVLPVGFPADAQMLLARILPGADVTPPPDARPPGRARWRTPLSYWSLRAWEDGIYLRTRTGRVRAATVVVPLEKVPSLRYEQGPLQRWERVATVHAEPAAWHSHASDTVR